MTSSGEVAHCNQWKKSLLCGPPIHWPLKNVRNTKAFYSESYWFACFVETWRTLWKTTKVSFSGIVVYTNRFCLILHTGPLSGKSKVHNGKMLCNVDVDESWFSLAGALWLSMALWLWKPSVHQFHHLMHVRGYSLIKSKKIKSIYIINHIQLLEENQEY